VCRYLTQAPPSCAFVVPPQEVCRPLAKSENVKKRFEVKWQLHHFGFVPSFILYSQSANF
jgi:hypothetical protein